MRLSYIGVSFCLVLAVGCTVSTQGAGDSDKDPVTGDPSASDTSTTPSMTSTTPGTSTNTSSPDDDELMAMDDDSASDDDATGDGEPTSEQDTSDDEPPTQSEADDTETEDTDETEADDDDTFGDDFPWDRDDDEETDATDETTVDTDDDSDETEQDTDTDDSTDTDDTDTTEPEVPGPDCVPDYGCEPEAPNTGDFYADCVARVNQFRACVCLPPLERANDAESCLDEQSEYDSTNGAHAGFSDNICEPRGNAQNECPGWGSPDDVVDGCIQSMFNEGPPPTEECEGDCYQAHGHYINMTGTRYTRVACGMYQDGDETWSVQNFF